jgi:hypothetical protein
MMFSNDFYGGGVKEIGPRNKHMLMDEYMSDMQEEDYAGWVARHPSRPHREGKPRNGMREKP